MRNVIIGAAVLLVSVTAAAVEPGGVLKPDSGLITKASPYSVAETIDRVEVAAKGVGANIYARIDMQELAKKNGVEVKANQLILFGRGKGGAHLLHAAPVSGIDLPFKALAWEDGDSKVWLTYTNGTYMEMRYDVKEAAKAVNNINETIEKIMGEALQK
jgi:uncharacterized protein (DUF302 family)